MGNPPRPYDSSLIPPITPEQVAPGVNSAPAALCRLRRTKVEWFRPSAMLPEEGLESPDCGITLCLMSTLVRVQHRGQMTIPSTVRSAVGLADGDMVEVRAVGRKIVITPQLMI